MEALVNYNLAEINYNLAELEKESIASYKDGKCDYVDCGLPRFEEEIVTFEVMADPRIKSHMYKFNACKLHHKEFVMRDNSYSKIDIFYDIIEGRINGRWV